MTIRRFDINPWQTEWGSGIDKDDSANGDYCDAEEVTAAIGERDAEIERLRAALAQVWQPINNSKVPCTQFDYSGANQHGDYLVVWNIEEEVTVHLPDDVRLCRKVTP